MKCKVFLLFLLGLILCSMVCFSSITVSSAQFINTYDIPKWSQETPEWQKKLQSSYVFEYNEFLKEEFNKQGYEADVKLRNGTTLHGYILNENFKMYVNSLKKYIQCSMSKIRSITTRNVLSDKVIFKDGTEFKGTLGGAYDKPPSIYMRFLKIRLSYNDEEGVLDWLDVKSIFFGW